MAEQPLSLILKSETLLHENDSHNQYHFLFKSTRVIAFRPLGNQVRGAGDTTRRRSFEEEADSAGKSGLE